MRMYEATLHIKRTVYTWKHEQTVNVYVATLIRRSIRRRQPWADGQSVRGNLEQTVSLYVAIPGQTVSVYVATLGRGSVCARVRWVIQCFTTDTGESWCPIQSLSHSDGMIQDYHHPGHCHRKVWTCFPWCRDILLNTQIWFHLIVVLMKVSFVMCQYLPTVRCQKRRFGEQPTRT